jgi:hypothetical protein
MGRAHILRLISAAIGILAIPAALPMLAHAQAREVTAAAPHDLSVTVYRSPHRGEGGFELDSLEGFALITETRRVTLPAGEHRLRFEGVADGIEAASAIITGLPDGVIEKNRDAALISPSALIEAAQAQGGRVLLNRSKPGSGASTRTEGVIRSGADGGVVFETPEGVEALRCSGLSETFSFQNAATGLSARPTLSVLTRTTRPVEAVVQLSYLSFGFDWSADYVANTQPSGKLDLGAWITLANGNGTSFPDARVQIVAGRLNRETEEVEPIDIGRPILARCWPLGSTSDPVAPITIERAFPLGFDPNRFPYPMPAPAMANRVVVTGSLMEKSQDAAVAVTAVQEDLGDLKLYRMPERVTVASRQSKQVRMLDRAGVTVTRLYEADFYIGDEVGFEPATAMLRTRNDEKNKLGLPLPSGRLALFEPVGSGASARRLLAGEAPVRDLAVNEEVEIRFEGGPDVQARQVVETREADDPPFLPLPFLPGFNDRNTPEFSRVSRIELSNARPYPVQVEVRLDADENGKIVKANRPVAQKNGRPIFRVTVPANSSYEIRYQTAPN